MGYAAPEQISHQQYEREVDMWSVGVVAYVLLSGAMPFDPAHYADTLQGEGFKVHTALGVGWELGVGVAAGRGLQGRALQGRCNMHSTCTCTCPRAPPPCTPNECSEGVSSGAASPIPTPTPTPTPNQVMLVDEQWRGVSGPAKDFVLQLLQLAPQKRLKVEQALLVIGVGSGPGS
eukprot:scaffold4570_cov56-Phaeocystis_antarctica.AAC.2